MSEPHGQTLSAVLDRAVAQADGERVTLGEVLDRQHGESFGPLLFLIGLFAISPVGMIPGMSVVFGTMIILVAGQLLLFRDAPWLPGFLRNRSFSKQKLEKTNERLKPWLRRVQWLVGKRLVVLVRPPAAQAIAAVCVLLAVTFYPLALVPFGVALPASAVVLFGVALTAQDGLLALLGLVLSAAAAFLVVSCWPS